MDRLIESVVAWREAVRDEERLLLRQFAKDVLADLEKGFVPTIPKVEVFGLFHPDRLSSEQLALTIGGRVEQVDRQGDVVVEFIHKTGGGYGVTVSRDGIDCTCGPGGPVLMMNGSFRSTPEKLAGTGRSFVLVNGDFTADKLYIQGEIIVCTGNVSLDQAPVEGSLIIAGGEIDTHGFDRKGTRLFLLC